MARKRNGKNNDEKRRVWSQTELLEMAKVIFERSECKDGFYQPYYVRTDGTVETFGTNPKTGEPTVLKYGSFPLEECKYRYVPFGEGNEATVKEVYTALRKNPEYIDLYSDMSIEESNWFLNCLAAFDRHIAPCMLPKTKRRASLGINAIDYLLGKDRGDR